MGHDRADEADAPGDTRGPPLVTRGQKLPFGFELTPPEVPWRHS
jgi:hypothetical protein